MKTLIFDFDGTIADSFSTLLGIFEEIAPREDKLTPKEIEYLREQTLRGILKHLKIKNWQIPRLMIKGKRAMARKIADVKPFTGLPGVLKQLHGEGYEMFILSTNSQENINKFLEDHRIDSYFESVHGDIGLFSKASALRKVLKRESIRPSEAIYLGDEVRDVEAAKKVGLTHISVGWGFNHPDTLKKADPDALALKSPDLLRIIKKFS